MNGSSQERLAFKAKVDHTYVSHLERDLKSDRKQLVLSGEEGYHKNMVVIQGKLIDPWHVELAEAIPPGEESIQVQLVSPGQSEAFDRVLLTRNPSFDFLRGEPDLYE